jgi:putative transposase
MVERIRGTTNGHDIEKGGARASTRVNHRNGYRPREWDTRPGTVELSVPRLRSGITPLAVEGPPRAEQALISMVATAYLLGVSTRWVEKLAEGLGVTELSKSQDSAMARHLDEQFAALRNRIRGAGPEHQKTDVISSLLLNALHGMVSKASRSMRG